MILIILALKDGGSKIVDPQFSNSGSATVSTRNTRSSLGFAKSGVKIIATPNINVVLIER